MSKTLNELRDEAHKIAVDHGFKDASIGEDLMLMVTELAEAMEDRRHGKLAHEMTYEEKKVHKQDPRCAVRDGDLVLTNEDPLQIQNRMGARLKGVKMFDIEAAKRHAGVK